MNFKLYIVIFLIALSGINVFAQSGAGLYLTASDFVSKKLSYQSKHSRVKTHEVFKKDIIQIICNDSTYTFKKDSVYGYRSKDGIDYRIVEGKLFPIINPAESILIYKWQESAGMKGQTPTFKYYFSKDHHSPLYILSLNNLEKVFASNKKFLKILEMYFGDHSNLLEYDSVHAIYKINRLLKLSEDE